jgi:hypothetical protein
LWNAQPNRSVAAQIGHYVAQAARAADGDRAGDDDQDGRVVMAQSTMSLHKDAVTAAEVSRQNAMAVPGVTAAAAKAADAAYHSAVVVSAMANSISPSVNLQALRALGASPPALPSVAPHLAPDQLPVERPGAPDEKPALPVKPRR